HLGLDEISAERVELVEPEVIARCVGVSTQVAEVLHQDEGSVELGVGEGRVLGHASQGAGASRLVGRVGRRAELAYGRVALRRRGRDARVGEERVNELRGRLRRRESGDEVWTRDEVSEV